MYTPAPLGWKSSSTELGCSSGVPLPPPPPPPPRGVHTRAWPLDDATVRVSLAVSPSAEVAGSSPTDPNAWVLVPAPVLALRLMLISPYTALK